MTERCKYAGPDRPDGRTWCEWAQWIVSPLHCERCLDYQQRHKGHPYEQPREREGGRGLEREGELADIEGALKDGGITGVGAPFANTADAIRGTIAALRHKETRIKELEAEFRNLARLKRAADRAHCVAVAGGSRADVDEAYDALIEAEDAIAEKYVDTGTGA